VNYSSWEGNWCKREYLIGYRTHDGGEVDFSTVPWSGEDKVRTH
jgi:hypothetical protein